MAGERMKLYSPKFSVSQSRSKPKAIMTQPIERMDSPRETWIDNARVLAIFSVIGVHSSATALALSPLGTGDWWIAAFYASALRWAAPLFLMISGYNLLNSSLVDKPGEFYRKRLSKIAGPLAFWCVVYEIHHVIGVYRRHESISFHEEILSVLTGRNYVSVWFIYAIFGLYMIAPVIRLIIVNFEKRELNILLYLGFLIACINFLFEFYCNIPQEGLLVTIFIKYIPYFALGGSLKKYPFDLKYQKITAIIAMALIMYISYFVYREGKIDKLGLFFDYNNPLIVILTISSFFTIKKMKAPVIGRFTRKISAITLGIYFVHPYFMKLMDHLLPMPGTPPLVLIPAMAVSAGLLSAIFVIVVKRFSFSRYIF